MKTRNLLIIFGILFLLVLQSFFLSAQNEGAEVFSQGQETPEAEGLAINSQGDVRWEISKDGKTATVFFAESPISETGTFVEIAGNKFENILPAEKSLKDSFLKIDPEGNILEADLTADTEGGDYWINGIKVHLDSGERVYYNGKENKFYLEKGASITDSSVDLEAYPEKQFSVKTEEPLPVLGVMLNGEATITKDGTLLKSGSAIFNNQELLIEKESVLIAQETFDVSEYSENWIQPSKDKLQMKSSLTGKFKVKFLENSILKNPKYSKFDVEIMQGDGLEIEWLEDEGFPVVTHKNSENGMTEIIDGTLKFEITKDGQFLTDSFNSQEILEERYKPAAVMIMSDSEFTSLSKMNFIDEKGTLRGYDKFSSLAQPENTYKNEKLESLFENLDDAELKTIALELKNNKAAGNDDMILVSELFGNSLDNGLNKEQALSFTKEVIKVSEEKFPLISQAIYGYEAIPSSDKKRALLLSTIAIGKKTENLNNFPRLLDFFKRSDLEKADPGLYSDFLEKMTQTDFFKKESYDLNVLTPHYANAIAQYNGENFNEISQGIEIAKRYNVQPTIFREEEYNMKYAELKSKQDIIDKFSSAINNYFETKGELSEREVSSTFSGVIDDMHLAEDVIEDTDNLREGIINNLNLKSKYYLISQPNSELFTSTFEKIYKTLPEKKIEAAKQIDPEGKYWGNFYVRLASKGKESDLIKEDPSFVTGAVKEILENKESLRDLRKNAVFSSSSLIPLYENPEYQKEKIELENFLVEKYSQAKETDEKAVYAYLLKLDENPLSEDAKNIYASLPSLPEADIPKRFYDKRVLSADLYFYDDEKWFYLSADEFQKKYKMNLVKTTENERVFKQMLGNGKEIRIYLNLVPEYGYARKKEGDSVIESHRGHSFHLDQTFPVYGEKDYSDKILLLGSCGSFDDAPAILESYPNSNIICDKNVGKAIVSNRVTYQTLKNIAEGREIDSGLKELAKQEDIVFPDDPSLLLEKYAAKF